MNNISEIQFLALGYAKTTFENYLNNNTSASEIEKLEIFKNYYFNAVEYYANAIFPSLPDLLSEIKV